MEDFVFDFSSEMSQTLFYILLTILGAVAADNILRSVVKVPKGMENRHTKTYTVMLHKAITAVIYVLAFYFISLKFGVNITPLLASASIIGIVVGIGARALIEDLINGFFMLTQDSIALGDYVKLDDAEGIVEKLGFRSLTVRGDSGELHIIPNGQVKKIVNFSRHRSYMNVDFPVKADQNIDPVLKALEEALDELKNDKELTGLIFSSSEVLGIEEFKTDGRLVARGKIVTVSEHRLTAGRKYRYLVKKNFEKYKVMLV
jgi:small conductance mechanosensitive channel